MASTNSPSASVPKGLGDALPRIPSNHQGQREDSTGLQREEDRSEKIKLENSD